MISAEDVRRMAEENRKKVADTKFQRKYGIDTILMNGVRDGKSFYKFCQDTGCPPHHKDRYEELTRQYQEAQPKKDSFLDGFMREGR